MSPPDAAVPLPAAPAVHDADAPADNSRPADPGAEDEPTDAPGAAPPDDRPIADYGLISDGHCIALVARDGSIDWCCMPRMDADSCFGRLLDAGRGGHCLLTVDGAALARRYEPGSMVLTTGFEAPGGRAELHDFFPVYDAACRQTSRRLVRLLRCTEGEVEVRMEVLPRFDFGEVRPDLRARGPGLHIACGGDTGLVIHCDSPSLALNGPRDALHGRVRLAAGQTLRLSVHYVAPHELDAAVTDWPHDLAELDDDLQRTLAAWRQWSQQIQAPYAADPLTSRSALVLKALTYEPTGAMVAAATTSLPEAVGGTRNWDYRYSWVRDSALAVRALHAVGVAREAERFANFIERSAAGSAEQLQVMYGINGRRRLTEAELGGMRGWRGSRPVRIGNRAAHQGQLDIYGTLLELAWNHHGEGSRLDPLYWDFLAEVVEVVCRRWREPDHGIWEFRERPRHFVHSKVMCWVALERGCQLAQAHGCEAPIERWRQERDALRQAIETRGFDEARGCFVQAFDEPQLDAAVLLLPQFGFIEDHDPRMVGTVHALREELEEGGLLRRYLGDDGFDSREGVFLPCTFWLARSLARQGQVEEAWRCYDRAAACANDLGLLSEEFDPAAGIMLGNFPQVLTHVSQIAARRTLEDVGGAAAASWAPLAQGQPAQRAEGKQGA